MKSCRRSTRVSLLNEERVEEEEEERTHVGARPDPDRVQPTCRHLREDAHDLARCDDQAALVAGREGGTGGRATEEGSDEGGAEDGDGEGDGEDHPRVVAAHLCERIVCEGEEEGGGGACDGRAWRKRGRVELLRRGEG